MKLVHRDINKHFIFDDKFCNLIIENPNEFYRLTNELFNQCVLSQIGNWVLSDIELLDLSKNTLFIYDYYQINLNTKKVQNIINNEILNILKQRDYYEEFSQLNSQLISLNQNVLHAIDLPIEFNSEFCFEDFIKFSNYTIKESSNFLDKILSYIEIFIKLKNIKFIIFVNLFDVISTVELNTLLKQLKYFGLCVFFISANKKLNISNSKLEKSNLGRKNIFLQNFIPTNETELNGNKQESNLSQELLCNNDDKMIAEQNLNSNMNVSNERDLDNNEVTFIDIETTIIDNDLCII